MPRAAARSAICASGPTTVRCVSSVPFSMTAAGHCGIAAVLDQLATSAARLCRPMKITSEAEERA